MSDEIMVKAAQAMSAGDFKGAMDVFRGLIDSEPENPIGHYGWAEAAFMRLSIDMEEDVPAGKIMQVYKKAMALDEDNLEYVASFANFCLDWVVFQWPSRNTSVWRKWQIWLKSPSKTHSSMRAP
ncbi:MAG: hypothetical protein Ct9H90mP16_10100 [Candidatus Poseidoniales archaeon]|nr:MAG: hypothetical protein Ct9H90mP16_10100 [Candidatus Poseidoniales archaeon]